jgi:hypothetical protein
MCIKIGKVGGKWTKHEVAKSKLGSLEFGHHNSKYFITILKTTCWNVETMVGIVVMASGIE